MPVSDLVRKELDVAAQAAVDKLGTDLVAIDLSEQSLLSEAFLIVTGNNPKDRKSTRLNSSHSQQSRMPSSA